MATKKFVPRPDVVKVVNRTYGIHWLEHSEWVKHKDLNAEQRGVSEHVSASIYMRLSHDELRSSDCMLREVLLHEILHCVASASMMWNCWDEIDRVKRDDFSTVEEIIIGEWAPAMLTMMKENPHVMAYLVDDKEHA